MVLWQTDIAHSLPLVCKSWRQLDANDSLWRDVFRMQVVRLCLAGLPAPQHQPPRRPRTSLRRWMVADAVSRTSILRLRHDELLRRCYRLFCTPGFDNPSALRKLLQQFGSHLDVNVQSPIHEANTLLNLAARCGCVKCAKDLLLRWGARVELGDDGGFTPLINAAWRGDGDMVRLLLSFGAETAPAGSSKGSAPLTAHGWAVARGHIEVAAQLEDAQRLRAVASVRSPGGLRGGNAGSSPDAKKRKRTAGGGTQDD